MKRINCPVEYVAGHLRNGHYELVLSDEEYKKFEESSREEKEDWIRDGEFILDDYSLEDAGPLEIDNLEVYTPNWTEN